jgi:hypothetical protein
MKCLEKRKDIDDIVKSFESDNQLVKMWVSFLEHNHWMQRPNGEWTITDKGRGKMKQYDGERDSSFC